MSTGPGEVVLRERGWDLESVAESWVPPAPLPGPPDAEASVYRGQGPGH